MLQFKDVEVRICAAKSGGNGAPSVHEVEVRVEGSAPWKGESTFDFVSLDPGDPRAYGKALGTQLANPKFIRALDQAGLSRNENIRLRLWLDDDPSVPHYIRWERAWFSIGGTDWRLAVHPQVAFSRFVTVEVPNEDPPDAGFFRLLFVISNPTGLASDEQINVEDEIGKFVAEFEQGPVDRRLQITILPGRTGLSSELQERAKKQGWSVLPGAATLQNISDELHKKYHGLHILAHGNFEDGIGSLVLENEQGGRMDARDSELQSWVTPELQIVVFQSCLSAGVVAEGESPFTGLAPRLIRQGIPAAVAMQDYVEMDDARTFFSEFYRTILNEGLVDVAVNRGRQRLIKDSIRDSWTIPVLYSRLRTGKLWNPDPLRESVLKTLDNLPVDLMTKWPSQQAIEFKRGPAFYDPVQGVTGPRFSLWERSCELAVKPGVVTVLTGGRGSFKAAQLRRLFRYFAEQYRAAKSELTPILVSLADLAGTLDQCDGCLRRLLSGNPQPQDLARIEGRSLVFMIDGEDELDGTPRERALAALVRLRDLPNCKTSIFLVADEFLVPELSRDFQNSILLVAQPLNRSRILSYLQDLELPAATNLRKAIWDHGYADLASQPRFLQHMLDLSGRGVPLESQRGILGRIGETYLARMDTRRVPRSCAEDAVQRVAWEIQMGRGVEVDGRELYVALNDARDGREFSLSDLKNALVGECRLLVPSGTEGVRFAYPVMQAYFAARYLATQPDRKRVVEDITASLGRLARLRRWEKVLVLCAGMVPNPEELLNAVLAGSSLMEGEQLYLAVRCYHEAVSQAKHTCNMDPVVDQMFDTLIWRSSYDPRKPYEDRRKALERLVELATMFEPRQQDAVRHMLTLACDPLPQSPSGSDMQFDWSGIRQGAATGLLRLYHQTTAFVKENRPDLSDALSAWWLLREQPEAMYRILLRDDASISVVASIAMALSDSETNHKQLIDAYEQVTNKEVRWGIVDALCNLDSVWVQSNVVRPWIAKMNGNVVCGPDCFTFELRACHTCYLIQKTNFATPEAREFLAHCLHNGTTLMQGRALRAFGKLQEPEIEDWLRPLCESIVRLAAKGIDPARMRISPNDLTQPHLQRSALEALRDTGNSRSLEIVRRARSLYASHDLRQLSFQTAEELYWRLAGGLESEYATAAALPTTKGEER